MRKLDDYERALRLSNENKNRPFDESLPNDATTHIKNIRRLFTEISKCISRFSSPIAARFPSNRDKLGSFREIETSVKKCHYMAMKLKPTNNCKYEVYRLMKYNHQN